MPRLRVIPLAAVATGLIGCLRAAPEPAATTAADVRVAAAPEPTPPAPTPVAPMPRAGAARLPVAPPPHESGEIDLTTTDLGIEANLPDLKLDLQLPDPRKPAEIDLTAPPAAVGPPPPAFLNPPGGSFHDDPKAPAAAFPGRTGATKRTLLREGGGTAESEKAVALGLAWLAKQQKEDGSWEFDATGKAHKAAATGLALLAFLGAGETHKPVREKEERKYAKVVSAGLTFLMKQCPPAGPNAGRISANMYEQAIATIPLCEAYGMTKDPLLQPHAQAAINYIMKAQGPNGSWGYAAGSNGDTSIVGWQVQALQAAKLANLVVDDRVIKSAVKFLDSAAGGSRKSMYGYADNAGAAAGTSLTAVGLLCRYYIDGWGPSHPGLIDGVAGLTKNPPAGKGGIKNLYYYYYATQVVHFYEGEDWKNWNEGPKGADGKRAGGMRDWLVGQQVAKEGDKLGSWDPEGGVFGSSCGRLGTTAMCLLTLEVYYRHLPLYKRGADGNAVKILEDK